MFAVLDCSLIIDLLSNLNPNINFFLDDQASEPDDEHDEEKRSSFHQSSFDELLGKK